MNDADLHQQWRIQDKKTLKIFQEATHEEKIKLFRAPISGYPEGHPQRAEAERQLKILCKT